MKASIWKPSSDIPSMLEREIVLFRIGICSCYINNYYFVYYTLTINSLANSDYNIYIFNLNTFVEMLRNELMRKQQEDVLRLNRDFQNQLSSLTLQLQRANQATSREVLSVISSNLSYYKNHTE